MARKESEPETPQQVPTWFLTYSDVITLLMTFFILLLTFATDEPEKFERLQISLFGGGGATGVAGPPQEPLETDTIVMRTRPRAGRMTMRGAEIPPIDKQASTHGVRKGLAGLTEEKIRDLDKRHTISTDLEKMLDDDGHPTALGHQVFDRLAARLRSGPYDLAIEAPGEHCDRVIQLAQHLYENRGVVPGRISVGLSPAADPAKTLRLTITRVRPDSHSPTARSMGRQEDDARPMKSPADGPGKDPATAPQAGRTGNP